MGPKITPTGKPGNAALAACPYTEESPSVAMFSARDRYDSACAVNAGSAGAASLHL